MINFNPYQTMQFPYLQQPSPRPQITDIPAPTYQQNIPSVNGIEEAKSLGIGKNATALMLDANQNVLYVKSTDAIGAITSFAAFEMKQINLDGVGNAKNDDRMSKIENDIAEIKKLLNDRRFNNGKQYSSDDRKQKQQS